MTKLIVKRVKVMEDAKKGPAHFDFARALRESRLRAATGNPLPQTPITDEMMADPVNGEFWRRMFNARERVRLMKPAGSNQGDKC
ncbi:hypothetical protein SBDP1_120001 [Syntrophobacter sp. SbD1]|nr:hypothetical protein SBDP1_120001 [Syntrophobacter sp. SbD1]